MSQTSSERVRWTSADLELLPDNGNRYEIIDGELFVTRAPGWGHQKVCGNICTELNLWSRQTGLGEVASGAGIVFTDADNVIPDLVWASNERLAALLDDAGHLTAAPELVVEVLSPGEANERTRHRGKTKALRCTRSTGILDYKSTVAANSSLSPRTGYFSACSDFVC